MTYVLLTLLALAGCLPGAPELHPPDTAPAVVHAGLEPGDSIDGLDLAVAPDGTVHLVWLEREGGLSGGNRIMYRRGRGDPLRWDAPLLVTGQAPDRPQVVVRRDGVHVLAGLRLHHWWLPRGADHWQAQAALLDDGDPFAHEFDAVAVGDGVVVAYTRSPMAGESVVYGVRWGNDGVDEPALVAGYPGPASDRIRLGLPTLLPQADRLLLLWAVNALVETRKEPYAGVRSEGHLYAAWSGDGGARWTAPVAVTSGAPARTFLHDAAATGLDGDPLAVFAANGLFASRWRGGDWLPPRQVADYDIGDLSGSAKTFHTVAAQCAGQPVVAWVDGRYQRSDRRWWNPLGGFPWSDNPDWINNDLFVLAGRELQAALRGKPVQPRRQTTPGSYTADVAMAVHGDEALLVWAGRARVEKSRDDLGAPPTIWMRRIECG